MDNKKSFLVLFVAVLLLVMVSSPVLAGSTSNARIDAYPIEGINPVINSKNFYQGNVVGVKVKAPIGDYNWIIVRDGSTVLAQGTCQVTAVDYEFSTGYELTSDDVNHRITVQVSQEGVGSERDSFRVKVIK